MKKEDVRNVPTVLKRKASVDFIPGSLSLSDQNYINIRKHLQKVIHEVKSTHLLNKIRVTIEDDIDSCLLKLPQVGCCGRIVKEWITNTLAHAFKGQHECIIKVTFKEVNHLRFLLRIEDNGVNHYSGYLAAPGRKTVDNLIKLLNGKSTITSDHGTTLQIVFDFQADLVETPEMSIN